MFQNWIFKLKMLRKNMFDIFFDQIRDIFSDRRRRIADQVLKMALILHINRIQTELQMKWYLRTLPSINHLIT